MLVFLKDNGGCDGEPPSPSKDELAAARDSAAAAAGLGQRCVGCFVYFKPFS